MDDEEENALLQYCFGDIYGENYGFRTVIEFDEECEEGEVDCDLNLEDENIRGEEQFTNRRPEEFTSRGNINSYENFN